MNNIKVIFIVTFATLFCISCEKDYLIKFPPDALSETVYFKTADQAKAATLAAYSTLESQNLYTKYLTKLFETPTGDVVLNNTAGYDFMGYTFSAADIHLMGTYSKLYEGVYRSNTVIKKVPLIDMDVSLRDRYVAEAKFLRALYYWHLTTLWGEVPLFTTPFETLNDAMVAKSSIDDIYNVMIQDLLDAESVLPASYGASDVGRATKGAAQALLGKIYLYDKNYPEAKNWLSKVINSKQYALIDNYANIINVNFENNKESIFEVQFAEIGGGGDVGNGLAGNDNAQVNGGTANTLPTQQLVNEFEPNDPRLSFSIFRDGDVFAPDLTTPNQNLDKYKAVWSATGYNIKKGLFPVAYINNRGTNWPIIRYADVLLLYAEAANELDLRDAARDAVNQVRQRPSVNMPMLTVSNTDTKSKMFDAIVHERWVELNLEYHRFNDLRRWGLAQEKLGHLGYVEAKNRYFPLPQEEIDINPNLKQIDGW